MSTRLVEAAHRYLDWARQRGAALDGSDESAWFVQGVLQSMAEAADEDPAERAIKCLAYSVYLADVLAASCRDVQCVVEADGRQLHAVLAVRPGGPVQSTLTWVQGCLEDPQVDNVVFKFAGALRDFGEHDRASRIVADGP